MSTLTKSDFDRYAKADPYGMVIFSAILVLHTMFRGVLYICVGFGVSEATGYGWWIVPIVAVALAMTVGRAWRAWRAPKVAETLKQLADKAEQAAGVP